jgi:hypothetical protein
VLALALAIPAAAEHKISMPDLVRDTQQQSKDSEGTTIVWWMPQEIWQSGLSSDGKLSPAQVEHVLSILRPYLMVAVVGAKAGPSGIPTFLPEELLRSRIRIVDSNGRSYLPLADDKLSADLKHLLTIMKPLFANFLGPMGENLRIFLFPARDADGREIASAPSSRSFDVQLGERRYHWRLPIGSVLPPKACPEDGELLNGAWTFCPWHGTRLKVQDTTTPPAAAPPTPNPSHP